VKLRVVAVKIDTRPSSSTQHLFDLVEKNRSWLTTMIVRLLIEAFSAIRATKSDDWWLVETRTFFSE